MGFFRRCLAGSGCRFGRNMVGTLLTVLPLRWLILLTVVAIPLILILLLAMLLFLLLLVIFSPVLYVLALLRRLKLRREDRVIEVDYWVRRED
jgi:hypothetical protein